MLFADFWWDCPHCQKMNSESLAKEDDPYKCRGCGRKYYLTFSVDVMEIDAYDDQTDLVYTPKMVEIEVSKDAGQTWEKMTVDTKDLNPDTSPLKPGWLLRHNGSTYKVYMHNSLKRLQTEKVAV